MRGCQSVVNLASPKVEDRVKAKRIKKKKFIGNIYSVIDEGGYEVNVFVEWIYRIVCAVHGNSGCRHADQVMKDY